MATQAQLAELKGDFKLMAQNVKRLGDGVERLAELISRAIARLEALEISERGTPLGFWAKDPTANT